MRLIALLVKHSGDQQNTITKVNLLNKVSWYKWKYRLMINLALLVITQVNHCQVLGIVAGVLLIDHDVRGTEFQQVGFYTTPKLLDEISPK